MSERTRFLIGYLVCMGTAISLGFYAGLQRISGNVLPIPQFIVALLLAGIATMIRLRKLRRRPPSPSAPGYNRGMKHAVNRISFVLTWACLLGLVCGIIYEARTHVLIFSGYISTFFGWALIFSIVNYWSRSPASRHQPPPASD